MKPAALLAFITDIHALGLETAQGLYLTAGWCWDLHDKSRAFAKRFLDKTGAMPTYNQAAYYSATMTYLNAVKAVGATDADKVMDQLRKMKVDDMYTSEQIIRPDGLLRNGGASTFMRGDQQVLEYLNRPSVTSSPRILDNWGYKEFAKTWNSPRFGAATPPRRCSMRTCLWPAFCFSMDSRTCSRSTSCGSAGTSGKRRVRFDRRDRCAGALSRSRAILRLVRDRVTKNLFEKSTADEEEYIDFLEAQLTLIGHLGVQLYSQKHVGHLPWRRSSALRWSGSKVISSDGVGDDQDFSHDGGQGDFAGATIGSDETIVEVAHR